MDLSKSLAHQCCQWAWHLNETRFPCGGVRARHSDSRSNHFVEVARDAVFPRRLARRHLFDRILHGPILKDRFETQLTTELLRQGALVGAQCAQKGPSAFLDTRPVGIWATVEHLSLSAKVVFCCVEEVLLLPVVMCGGVRLVLKLFNVAVHLSFPHIVEEGSAAGALVHKVFVVSIPRPSLLFAPDEAQQLFLCF